MALLKRIRIHHYAVHGHVSSSGLLSSSFSPAIKRLLSYAKNGGNDEDDDEKSEQAIKSLVKNLKKSGG